MSRIFLSYRREDTSGYAGRLHDDLVARFGKDRVFLDLGLEPGLDFEEAISHALASCSVVLVLMGRHFLDVVDSQGIRRIDKSDDHVRAEIAQALNQEIRVIPVRVQGAEMPQGAALPENIRALTKRQAVQLSDERWEYDVNQLLDVIGRVLGVKQPTGSTTLAEPQKQAGTLAPAHYLSGVLAFAGFVAACVLFTYAGIRQGVLEPQVNSWSGGISGWRVASALYFAIFGAIWGALSWWPLMIHRKERLLLKGVGVSILTWIVAWALVSQSSERFAYILILEETKAEEAQSYTWVAVLGALGATGTAVALRGMFSHYTGATVRSSVVIIVWAVVLCLTFALGNAIVMAGTGWVRGWLFSTTVWALGLILGSVITKLITRDWTRVAPASNSAPSTTLSADSTVATDAPPADERLGRT